MDYKAITYDFIEKYCIDNNQVEWLKQFIGKTTKCEVYPKKRIPQLNADGTPALNAKGKPIMVSVADKSQKPTIEERPITFVEVKMAFVNKFMPEIAPKKKEEKPSFHDRIAQL